MEEQKNHKLLYFIKVPPPITGAALMNQRVNKSLLLRKNFDVRSIEISYANKVNNFGRLSFSKLLTLFSVFVKLIFELLFHRPELIYFQISPTGFAFIRDSVFVFIMKLFSVKILFHLRGKGIKKITDSSIFLKKYYKYVFKETDVICLSELLTYDVEDIYSGKPYIVYNGIPMIPDYQEKKINNTTELNILYLSNLIVEKGILDYIDAMQILIEKGYKIQGTIVGNEGDISKENLIKLLKQKRVDKQICFKGPKYDKEKFEEYKDADIFVFPTYYSVEAFPGVILEAMQYELPVISTCEASIPLIIDDNKTGFLIPINNATQIAEKLELLINNSEVRLEMGQEGRKKYLENFTFNIFEKNLSQVFIKIFNNRQN